MTYRTYAYGIVSLLFAATLAAQQSAPKPSPSPSPSASPTPAAEVDLIAKAADQKLPQKKDCRPATTLSVSEGMEIISETYGVDFKPYIKRVKSEINSRWAPLVPQNARFPEMRQGQATIGFTILRDGQVTELKITESSGDAGMDRAGYGAISSSSPLPSLPAAFTGRYLRICAHFFYNPGPQKK